MRSAILWVVFLAFFAFHQAAPPGQQNITDRGGNSSIIGTMKGWSFVIDSEADWNEGTFNLTATDGSGALQLSEDIALYGDGSDGDAVITSDTILTGDMNYHDLTVYGGRILDTAGYTIRVSGTLLNLGTITDAQSGGLGGDGGIGGDGGSFQGGHQYPDYGTSGDTGGFPSHSQAGHGGNGGSGGGGGGCAWDHQEMEEAAGGKGGDGGQGGHGGGMVSLYARTLDNQGVIHADGEHGGDGQSGVEGEYTFYEEGIWPFQYDRDMAGGGGGGGAAGSGGDGGTVEITYAHLASQGTVTAQGGSPGSTASGGVGKNTYENPGSSQHEESGAIGGGGANPGGEGGRSEIQGGASENGQAGGAGSSGQAGSVTLTKVITFEAVGDYTSKMFAPGETVNWIDAEVEVDTPSGTDVSVEYGENGSGSWQWYDLITDVPDSDALMIRITLSTTDTSLTPSVDRVMVYYLSDTNNPPCPPGFPVPQDGASEQDRETIVSWIGGDPDLGDGVVYDIYYGTISPPSLVSSGQAELQYDPGTLSYNTTHYWKVVAWDSFGASTEGPEWSFTTEAEKIFVIDSEGEWKEGAFQGTATDGAGRLVLGGDPALYGDGADGDVTLFAYSTLDSDKSYRNVTVGFGATLDTAGYTLRVSGALNNAGVITDTVSGGTGGSGGDGGTGGHGYSFHYAPTNGQPGDSGSAPSVPDAGYGGHGGGGGGGGGGAWDDNSYEEAKGGGGGSGGDGGSGGGHVKVFARLLDSQGVMHADGEDGQDGQPGVEGTYRFYEEEIWPFTYDRDMAGGGGGGGAAGKGGDGGTVDLTYGYLSNMGTVSVQGGDSGGIGSGGSGKNTHYLRGDDQHDENGGDGGGSGPGDGGDGGWSEADPGSSQSGDPGSNVSSGILGEVFTTQDLTFQPSGIYLSKMLDPGAVVNWTGAEVELDIPSGTKVKVRYGEDTSGNWQWYAMIDNVPDCRWLKVKVLLYTGNTAVTPAVDRITVRYATDHTIHVPADYATIQEAIDMAASGNTVLVAPGTYTENIDFLGRAVTVKGAAGPAATVIDGNQVGSVVTFEHGEGFGSVLEGFTVTNGSASASTGGGVHCEGASPMIRNNIICLNESTGAAGGGSGIHLSGSAPLIRGNLVRENTAFDGGAIRCENGSAPMIVGNTISDNITSNSGGGGIDLNQASPWIADNVIRDNESPDFGGGISCRSHSSPMIVNNMVNGNLAYWAGGGIHCGPAVCMPVIVNTTIYGNSAIHYGGGIHCAAYAAVANTILWGNSAGSGPEICVGYQHLDNASVNILYSDVEGGQGTCHVASGCTLHWDAGSMVQSDPLFKDPVLNELGLTVSSPCIDVGWNSAVPSWILNDYEGDPRKVPGLAPGKGTLARPVGSPSQEPSVDLGADEFCVIVNQETTSK